MPSINRQESIFKTPWFELVSKSVSGGHEDGAVYYSINAPDYVAVYALDENGKVILVKQYRPVIERMTLELPAGTVDPGERPDDAMRREFEEETGYTIQELELLATLRPDTGRLGNHMWCYLSRCAQRIRTSWKPEPGIEIILGDPADLLKPVDGAEFNHALSLVVALMAQERLRKPC